MAVVGIDFGSLASKIGVARHRGIDIITNEVSNRATPSLVAFGPKQRHIGESAKTQETSNFKNTIGSLKRLIGRTLTDTDVEAEKKFINAKLVDIGGSVGVSVTFRGETQTYTSTQLVSMYLSKLASTAASELKLPSISDIVIAVPGWFTDVQRHAILDAAAISGLNVLRLINDTTASALGYGITKSDLPEEGEGKTRNVVFVDVGHSDLSVSVVSFWKSNLSVRSSAYDRHLGGRDIDFALLKHFSDEFKGKYKIDVMANPKATFRLLAGCEKLKKVLSANLEGILNVESIVADVDASSKMNREEYEGLIAPLLARIPAPIQQALAESGFSLDEIDAIELVGGSTRIPAVRAAIASVFPGKVLSTTLNQDEAVARGATFSCAMLSPVFRVREFHMLDVTHYPVVFRWERVEGDSPDDDTELEVYRRGNNVPSTKVLTFYRKGGEGFSIEATYPNTAHLPGSIKPWIGKGDIKDVPPSKSSEGGEGLTCVRVKTRLNNHGVLSVESAYVEEIEEKEEVVAAASGGMDVDAPVTDPSAPPVAPTKKTKRIVHKTPLKHQYHSTALPSSTISSLREIEVSLLSSDKLVMDTEDRKNALEEYIYDMRSKLDERYASFVKAAEKDVLSKELGEKEEWLYTEEGEDATKSAYVERLDALKKLGDPISRRWAESTLLLRPAAASLRETLDLYSSQASAPSPGPHDHISAEDKQKVIEKVEVTRQWLGDLMARQAERAKTDDPIVTSEEVGKRRDEVIYFVTPILSKPRPKVSGTDTPKKEEAPPPPPKDEPIEEMEDPAGKGYDEPSAAAKKDGAPGPTEMDVD